MINVSMYEVEDIDEIFCKRCNCCSTGWEDCPDCDENGYSDHDCGEDCCPCADPEPNVACDTCGGATGWLICIGHCDEHGLHRPEAKSA